MKRDGVRVAPMQRTRIGIPTPHARPPLERMLRIHTQLRDGGKVNCSTLAKDLEVCTKTVQRDIDFMRDRLGLPIEYDAQEFAYHYTEPVDQFPTVKVTEGELVALFVARKAVTQYHGTPFARPLRAAFEKITQGLTEHLSFSWGELDSAISFRSIGIPKEDLDLFEKLSQATLKSREVTFDYRKLRSAVHEPRRIQPYHLACIDHQWYLVAHDLDRSALRNFVLTRIKNVRVLNAKFTRAADFSIEKYLHDSFGIFKSFEKPQEIRVRFDAFAAQLVREREWHSSQKLKELPEGRLERTLTLENLQEIERWVLGWGEHAEVLAPSALRDSVRTSLRKASAFYNH